MPKSLLQGTENSFNVQCDWYQPDRETYLLRFGTQLLFALPDEDVKHLTQLNRLCVWLNDWKAALDLVQNEDGGEIQPTADGITAVTVHRTFRPVGGPGAVMFDEYWIAQIEGVYGTYFLQLPDEIQGNQLQEIIIAGYKQLAERKPS